MAERAPFKEIFSREALAWLAELLAPALPGFDKSRFMKDGGRNLGALEFKQRIENFARAVAAQLPEDFEAAAPLLRAALGPAPPPKSDEDFGDFRYWPLSRVVSLRGLDRPEASLDLLGDITKRISAEFDIRFFLVAHRDLSLARLNIWSRDADWRVRRLASEGSRPRLPWGLRLKEFVADPSPMLPILARLATDPNGAVRRSVANHLNDIAKDHPDLAADLAMDWRRRGFPERDIRHALRGPIKAGHKGALRAVGIDSGAKIALADLAVGKKRLAIGEAQEFSFTLTNRGKAAEISIDYRIRFARPNGRTAQKIFKLARKRLAPGETASFRRRHSFKDVSIRKHHPGLHALEILVNGVGLGAAEFRLTG